MKKLNAKVLFWVIGLVAVLGIGWALFNAFDVPTKWTVAKAINDIKRGQDLKSAREKLLEVGDRAYAIGELKAALADEGDPVTAKIDLLITLRPQYFNQTRVIRRSLDSKVVSTARAAAWLTWGDADLRDRCAEIALDWLQDQDADSRGRAVILCRRLEIRDAVPAMLKVLDEEPQDNDELELLRQSLAALKEFKTKGLADKLLKLAENQALHESVRAEALTTLSVLEDAPRDKVQAKAIALLKNKKNTTFLRSKMTGILRGKSYANQESWDALKSVLVDREDTDVYTQRNSLAALGYHAPLDWIQKLLLDKRVYNHPYYAVRVDVASAIGALNIRSDLALQIMGEYLTWEDPKDTRHQAREEAWLTLWQLTGAMHGVKQRDLFQRAPRPMRDPKLQREFLWRSSFTRPGVSQDQVKALHAVSGDLAEMQKIKQVYLSPQMISAVKARWEKEREAEEAAKTPKKDKPVGPVGPTPPPKKGS